MSRFTTRRLRGWARVAEAMALMTAAGAAQKWIPMPRWSRLLGRPTEVPPEWRGQPVEALGRRKGPQVEAAVASAVRRGAFRLPWTPTCLAEASAGQVMLRRRHHPGVVVIGLRPQTGTWDAHAWLLASGGVLTGGAAAKGFTATTVYEVPGGLRAADAHVLP